MATESDHKKEEGRRMVLIRMALGYDTAAEFCRDFGVGVDSQSAYETGIRTIPRRHFHELKRRHNIPADFIIHNDIANVPQAVAKKINEIQEDPNWALPKRGRRSGRKSLNKL